MIETARLRLRPLADADRDWIAAQAADTQVMRHLNGPQARAQSDERVDKMMRLQAERGFSFWVIERKADEERLGICGLKIVDAVNATRPGDLEIGWRLSPAHWRQGYAREAAGTTLDFAFGTLGGTCVVAHTGVGNSASWGLMERLGMTRRADLDFNDPAYPGEPTIVYLIEADAWTG